MNITIGDMAEAYYQLRQEYGLYYCPSNREIFEKASEIKNG